jgi:hypothetical protein
MARITKQKSAKFNKAIIDFAISLGATIKERSEDWRTVLDLKTIVGNMTITIYDKQEVCYTVFCKFDNPTKARKKFNCNGFSGKYNNHIGGCDVDNAIEIAKIHIETTQKEQ